MNTDDKGTALITGASSGIGAIYADRLARKGYDLVLVARSADRLDRLAERIAAETGREVHKIAADLTLDRGVELVEQRLATDTSISMLVNNAGVASTAGLRDLELATIQQIIALNVTALTRVARAAVTAFVAKGGGAIINMSSVLAVAPEFLKGGVYAGTKAYVLAFSQALLHEFGQQGIRVQVVLPGATATEIWARSGSPVHAQSASNFMTADDAVDAALAGFAQGEFATFPSLPNLEDWNSFEATRRSLMPGLSRNIPAPRYGLNR